VTYRNAGFLNSDAAKVWLSQFKPQDQETAIDLIQESLLVSRNNFVERLKLLVLERINESSGTVGLYVEREVRKYKGTPNRLFKESATKVKRAYGAGPAPVKPVKAYNPSVGSEGIVAQIVSEICKQNGENVLDHPGPDLIRSKKIRHFILVTDFIGSGTRIDNYLKAAWRIRSVKSWWSTRTRKGIIFEVVAYAATVKGGALVEANPTNPKVHNIATCPTISDLTYGRQKQLRKLCFDYDPLPKKADDSLGFGGMGALIAFAHGMPNNAPRLLHTSTKGWASLFPKRVTTENGSTFDKPDTDPDQVRERLHKIKQKRLAEADWIKDTKPWFRLQMIVLASLSKPPRSDEVLSLRTGFSILDIRKAVKVAITNNWIDDCRRLTDGGRSELENARKKGAEKVEVPSEPESLYYPKSLRGSL
jgi:hypothetical protein